MHSSIESAHFWHFFMGELLPFVDWLSERTCLPTSVTLYRKDARLPFASMYREIGESLGLSIDLVNVMTLDETERPKRDRACDYLETRLQHKWQHCRDETLWENLRSRIPNAIHGTPWQLEIPKCSAVFPPAFGASADGSPVATCENMYKFKRGNRIRCKDDLVQRKAWTQRFATVREWLLRWAGAKQERGRDRRAVGKLEVVVQTRKTEAAMVNYYKALQNKFKGHKSGSANYGSAKRNVTNLHDVAAELGCDARLNVRVASP